MFENTRINGPLVYLLFLVMQSASEILDIPPRLILHSVLTDLLMSMISNLCIELCYNFTQIMVGSLPCTVQIV